MRAIDARHNQMPVNTPVALRFGWQTLPMIAAYIFVVWGTFMWFEPAPIGSFYRWADKTTVMPGETVTITAHAFREKADCESTVIRTWRTDDNKTLVVSTFEMPALDQGMEIFNRPAIVPIEVLPNSTLWLNSTVEFRCNAVQRALGGTRFVMPDLKFIVQG